MTASAAIENVAVTVHLYAQLNSMDTVDRFVRPDLRVSKNFTTHFISKTQDINISRLNMQHDSCFEKQTPVWLMGAGSFPPEKCMKTVRNNDSTIVPAVASDILDSIESNRMITLLAFTDPIWQPLFAPINNNPIAQNDSYTTRPGQLLAIAAPGQIGRASCRERV